MATMLYLTVTVLQWAFGLGCLFGFYILLSILFGGRESWKFIYLISLVVLFFLIATITPKDYQNPLSKGKPTYEDYENGYREPPGDQYDPLP